MKTRNSHTLGAMMAKPGKSIAVIVLLLALAGRASAQDATPLAVGTVAPDFVLAGATKGGVLKDSLRLSDFRDQTVVIAFFYRARTRG